MNHIPLDLALRIANRRATERGYGLVMPDSPYRTAVLYGLAAAHAITGSGWSLDYAREHITTTLPGAGPLVSLLASVPYVGPILAGVASKVERPTVYLSPAALADGLTLLGTLAHEEGHVGDIRRGGPLWCACYGVIDEVRAGAEAPCFGCDMAARVALGGVDVSTAESDALASLTAYGLGADIVLARGLVRSNAETLREHGDPGGIVAELVSDLAREGWAP